MKYLLLRLAPILCVVASVVLALNGSDAWGWFLFVAVLLY